MTLTRSLLTAAVVATLADAAAFVGFVLPGRAAETNPLIAGLDPRSALAARAAVLILIAALTLVADVLDTRLVTAIVRIALGAAIVVGVLGFTSTIGALA